jgi:hypothetical protein
MASFVFCCVLLHQYRYEGFVEVEWARTLAILNQTPWPTEKSPPQIIKPGWDTAALGTDLSTYVNTIKYIYFLAQKKQNQFWRQYFDDNANVWAKVLDAKSAVGVIERHLAISELEFKKNELSIAKRSDSSLARYAINPLWSKPMIEVSRGHYIVPVGRLLIARTSPLGLFHSVDTSIRNAYAADLGIPF